MSKDTVTSPKPDTFEDIVTSPPPDPQPVVPHEAANDRHPSKAWYVLSDIFGVVGRDNCFCSTKKASQGYGV